MITEECFTNILLVTGITPVQWRRYSDQGTTGVEGKSTHNSTDTIRAAYSSLLEAGVLTSLQPVGSRTTPAEAIATEELWIFWWNEVPFTTIAAQLASLHQVGEGIATIVSVDAPDQVETPSTPERFLFPTLEGSKEAVGVIRQQFTLAVVRLMERFFIEKGGVRLGDRVVFPDAFPSINGKTSSGNFVQKGLPLSHNTTHSTAWNTGERVENQSMLALTLSVLMTSATIIIRAHTERFCLRRIRQSDVRRGNILLQVILAPNFVLGFVRIDRIGGTVEKNDRELLAHWAGKLSLPISALAPPMGLAPFVQIESEHRAYNNLRYPTSLIFVSGMAKWTDGTRVMTETAGADGLRFANGDFDMWSHVDPQKLLIDNALKCCAENQSSILIAPPSVSPPRKSTHRNISNIKITPIPTENLPQIPSFAVPIPTVNSGAFASSLGAGAKTSKPIPTVPNVPQFPSESTSLADINPGNNTATDMELEFVAPALTSNAFSSGFDFGGLETEDVTEDDFSFFDDPINSNSILPDAPRNGIGPTSLNIETELSMLVDPIASAVGNFIPVSGMATCTVAPSPPSMDRTEMPKSSDTRLDRQKVYEDLDTLDEGTTCIATKLYPVARDQEFAESRDAFSKTTYGKGYYIPTPFAPVELPPKLSIDDSKYGQGGKFAYSGHDLNLEKSNGTADHTDFGSTNRRSSTSTITYTASYCPPFVSEGVKTSGPSFEKEEMDTCGQDILDDSDMSSEDDGEATFVEEERERDLVANTNGVSTALFGDDTLRRSMRICPTSKPTIWLAMLATERSRAVTILCHQAGLACYPFGFDDIESPRFVLGATGNRRSGPEGIECFPCDPDESRGVLSDVRKAISKTFYTDTFVKPSNTDGCIQNPNAFALKMPAIVQGPLTLEKYQKLGEAKQLVRDNKSQTTLHQLPEPELLIGHSSDWLEASPSILYLWEKMFLEPYAGTKNISAYFLAPTGATAQHKARSWLREIGAIYNACGFGTHSVGSYAIAGDGIVGVPLLTPKPGEQNEAVRARSYRNAAQLLGSALVDYPHDPGGYIVIYMMDSIGGLGRLELCLSFDRLRHSYKCRGGDGSRLIFQIVPIRDILDDWSNSTVVPSSPLRAAAFSVYRRCPKFIERAEDTSSYPIPIHGPPYVLAQKLPEQVHFEMKRPATFPSPLHPEQSLHVAYLPGEAWVGVSWCDARGEFLEVTAIPRDVGTGWLNEVWESTLKIVKNFGVSWQIVVGRIGILTSEELRAWAELVKSESNVAIACFDAHAYLQIFPSNRSRQMKSTEPLRNGTSYYTLQGLPATDEREPSTTPNSAGMDINAPTTVHVQAIIPNHRLPLDSDSNLTSLASAYVNLFPKNADPSLSRMYAVHLLHDRSANPADDRVGWIARQWHELTFLEMGEVGRQGWPLHLEACRRVSSSLSLYVPPGEEVA